MKKILTWCAGIMLATTAQTNAQVFSVGPEVSIGHSWINNLDNIKFKLLGSAGVTAQYMFTRNMGISGTTGISWEGFRTHTVSDENGALKGYTRTYNAEYLRFTPKLVYLFGEDAMIRPKVGIGPSIAWKYNEARWTNEYKQDAKELIGSGSNDDRVPEVFDQIDFGVTADAGVNIRLSQNTSLNLGVAYYHGIVDVLDMPNRENENLRANIGLMFGL